MPGGPEPEMTRAPGQDILTGGPLVEEETGRRYFLAGVMRNVTVPPQLVLE